MENVFRTYEKFLSGGDMSETEDESDTDLSFDELLKDFVSSTPSKSRRSSVRAAVTLDRKSSFEQVEGLNFLTKFQQQQQVTNLEIPDDVLSALDQMGDEKVIEFIKELWTEFDKKQEEEPKLINQNLKSKLESQLEAIKILIQASEDRFQQHLKLIEQQNFGNKFVVNTNVYSGLDDKTRSIQENSNKLDEVIADFKLCKDMGLLQSNLNESNL